MEIDIISYTDEQLASLSVEQLQEVRQAQLKKNKLVAELEKEINRQTQSFSDRGLHDADNLAVRIEELRGECEREIAVIQEALRFYLQYARYETVPSTPSDVPYAVDYSLSVEARMEVVKAYYMQNYSGVQRAEMLLQDDFAKVYIGELYAPLYHYFLDLA